MRALQSEVPADEPQHRLPALVRLARPKQWIKNVLVIAAPGAAGVLGNGTALLRTAIAFACFCLAASGTYFLNDALDVDADRRHPTKRRRPIASGEVPVRTAITAGVVLLASAIALSFAARWQLSLVVGGYLLQTVVYSVWLKHEAGLDFACVASGFGLRTTAGGVGGRGARPKTSCSRIASCSRWARSGRSSSHSRCAVPDMANPESVGRELLSGWGRTSPTLATVHRPDDLEHIVSRVTAPSPRGVIARGLGRSYGDAAQNAGGDVLSCSKLDSVLALDVEKGTVTVESGVSLDTLLRVLLPLGWFPMVIPGTSYVTVGGAIASDIHGKFRHGSFADYVERMRIVTPARGACTLEPEADANGFWATSGGMGLTGVVTEATLKLQSVETSRIVCDTERTSDVDDCMQRMLERDHEYRYSVAWIDCLASGGHLGRAVLTRGNHATVDELPVSDRSTAREYAQRTLLAAPPLIP